AAQSGGVEDNPIHRDASAVAPTVPPCSGPASCPEPGEAGLGPRGGPPLPEEKSVWGCGARPPTEVAARGQEGEGGESIPWVDFPTVGDVLTANGVSWKMYAPAQGDDDAGFQGSAGYIWTVYDAIRHIRDSEEWKSHVVPTEQFAIDAKAGNL